MRQRKHGFTLIELLVVVLIIAILAAVALPQYQKAVEKSKAAQAIGLLKSLAGAVEIYKQETDQFPTTFEALDVVIPANFKPADIVSDVGEYNPRIAVSDGEWNLQLHYNPSTSLTTNNCHKAIVMIRLNGNYAGCGFSYAGCGHDIKQIVCFEPFSYKDAGRGGEYCSKLFNGKFTGSGKTGLFYSIF